MGRSSNLKCLICFTKVELKESDTDPLLNQEDPFLDQWRKGDLDLDEIRSFRRIEKQTNVIFILKNVLELRPKRLEKFLKVKGNPEDWTIRTCDYCSKKINKVKELFRELQRITWKYEETKKEIQEEIKKTNDLHKDISCSNSNFDIVQESRRIVCNRKPRTCPSSSFPMNIKTSLLWDRRAQNLARDRLHQETLKHGIEQQFGTTANNVEEDMKTRGTPITDFDQHIEINFSGPEADESSDENFDENRNQPAPTFEQDNDDSDPDFEIDVHEETGLDDPDVSVTPSKSKPTYFRKRRRDASSKPIRGIRKSRPRKTRTFCYKEGEMRCLDLLKTGRGELIKKQRADSDGNSNAREYSCNLCTNVNHLLVKDFIQHIHRYHLISYKCGKCDRGFKTMDTAPVSHHWRFCHRDEFRTTRPEYRVERASPSFPQIPWDCPLCTDKFTDEGLRDSHVETCPNRKPKNLKKPTFGCDICMKQYYTEEELQLHKIVHPESLNLIQCDLCQEYFKLESKLRLHRMQVHQLDLLKCAHCDEEFDDEKKYLEHLSITHKDLTCLEEFTCPTCPKAIFVDKASLTRHMKAKHEDVNNEAEEVFPCNQCADKKVFPTMTSLRQHEKNVHTEKSKTFACTFCSFTANQSSNLKYHLARWHDVGIENYKCFECGAFFLSRTKKFAHTCGVKEKSDMSYFCWICGKGFCTKPYLKQHITGVHEKIYKFHCEVPDCGFKTNEKLSYRKHKACKHNIGEWRCEVEGCDKAFHRQILLEQHVKYKHLGEERPRPFVCEVCAKTFLGREQLVNHMKIKHSDIRDFKCELCGLDFPTSGYLIQHKKAKHPEIKKDADTNL